MALAGALIAASGGEIDLVRLAQRCQAAELAATGVECGIQDQLAVALGDPVAARPLLERALAYREHHPVRADELADTRFELARLLGGDPEQLPRARELARQAELALRDLPTEARLHAEVVAWRARFDP